MFPDEMEFGEWWKSLEFCNMFSFNCNIQVFMNFVPAILFFLS